MSDVISTNQSAILANNAFEIKRLGKRAYEDINRIGQLLTECKKMLGHGNWLSWLDKEFGWTDDTAINYMNMYEMFKSRTVRDLNMPLKSLYLLAKPSTPESVRVEVLNKAESGAKITHTEVKKAVAEVKVNRLPVDNKKTEAIIQPACKECEALRAKILRLQKDSDVLRGIRQSLYEEEYDNLLNLPRL